MNPLPMTVLSYAMKMKLMADSSTTKYYVPYSKTLLVANQKQNATNEQKILMMSIALVLQFALSNAKVMKWNVLTG